MKKLFYVFMAITVMLTAFAISSCQSSNQKENEAKAKLENAEKDLVAAQQATAETARKAANNEEWQLFKKESEAQIKEDESSIAQLKEKMKTSGKKLDAIFQKNIEVLEGKIKDLNSKIENYDKNRSDWEAFKREFTHDMDEFKNAFKDLTVNNKK